MNQSNLALSATAGATIASAVSPQPSAQRMLFADFAANATCTKLRNHGQDWEVFLRGETMGFACGTAAEALRRAHERAVNNALYAHTPDAPYWLVEEMPSPEVLQEYPEIVARFPGVVAAAGLQGGAQ